MLPYPLDAPGWSGVQATKKNVEEALNDTPRVLTMAAIGGALSALKLDPTGGTLPYISVGLAAWPMRDSIKRCAQEWKIAAAASVGTYLLSSLHLDPTNGLLPFASLSMLAYSTSDHWTPHVTKIKTGLEWWNSACNTIGETLNHIPIIGGLAKIAMQVVKVLPLAGLGVFAWEWLQTPIMAGINWVVAPIFNFFAGKAIFRGAQELAVQADRFDVWLGKYLASITFDGIANAIGAIGRFLVYDVGLKLIRDASWETWGILIGYVGVLFSITFGAKIIDQTIDYLALVAKASIGRPTTNIDIKTRIPIISPMLDVIGGVFNEIFPPEPVIPAHFQKDIKEKLDRYTRAINNIHKHGGDLQNIILEGPPGCGKTMVAKEITNATGFSFIRMSGAELIAYIEKNRHVSELNELMDRAERHSPCFIFIDECDTMLGHRDNLDRARTELLNAFLSRTGDPSKKIALIVATNRIADLDPAVISRMDHQIHIGTPDYLGRVKILTEYINKAFRGTEDRQTVLDDGGIELIAAKTNHLTGRALQKLVNSLKCARYASDDCRLTQKVIDEITHDFVWKDRLSIGSERSWRIVEMVNDLRHTTISPIIRTFKKALSVLFRPVISAARTTKDWTWEAVQPTANLITGAKVDAMNSLSLLWTGQKAAA